MSLIHLARQGFITKSALPSVTRTRGASYQPSLLLLGDGANNSTTIVDSSQNAFAITRYGDTKISTTQKPTGMTSSIYFDGTGDYLSLSDNALFDFGSGDFTVETNIYLNSLTSQQQIIGQWGALSSSSSFTLNIDTTSIIAAVVSNVSNYYVYTATVTLSINQWYHIAFVRYNNALKIFLNGKQIGSDVSVSGVTVNSTPTNPVLICYKEDNNQYINGYISNLRIVKGTALYTKNFFVPTLPPLFDLAQLDRLVVGLSDGAGACSGIGYLEHAPGEDLRLVTPVAAGPKALRLGGVRLDGSYQARRVDLRNLFGSE